MQIENKYIGDDKFQKMLNHYECLIPLEVIKMRFAGAICSPNLDLRPTDVISSFWIDGKAPRLATKDEADLFFKFFMGLWDEVFNKIKLNKISLSSIKTNKDELITSLQIRFEEIEMGFVEGFWGGRQDIKLATYLAEVIDSLSDLSNVYNVLLKRLDNSSDIVEIVETLKHTDAMVDKAIYFIIENSVLPRIDSLQKTVH